MKNFTNYTIFVSFLFIMSCAPLLADREYFSTEPEMIQEIAQIVEPIPPAAVARGSFAHPTEEKYNFEIIYFDYDSYLVSDKELPKVRRLAEYLKRNRSTKLLVMGHTDQRGTDEYNLQKAEKRALSVGKILIIEGVPKNRISIISCGEELPQDSRNTEEAWVKNNRVVFKLK